MSIKIGTSLDNVDINSNGKECYKHSSLYNINDYYGSSDRLLSGIFAWGYYNGAETAFGGANMFSCWANIGSSAVVNYRAVAQGNGRLISANYANNLFIGSILYYDSRFGTTMKGILRNAVESSKESGLSINGNFGATQYGYAVAIGNNQIYVIHLNYTSNSHKGRYIVYPLDLSKVNGSVGPRIGYVPSHMHGNYFEVGEIGTNSTYSSEDFIKAGQDRVLTSRSLDNGSCVVTNTLGVMMTRSIDSDCLSYSISNGNIYFGFNTNSVYGGTSYVSSNSRGYFSIHDLYGQRKGENITFGTSSSVYTNYTRMTSGCGIVAISHTGWTYDTGSNRGKVSLFTAGGEFIKDIYDLYVHQPNAYYGQSVIIKNNLIFVLAPGYKSLSTTAKTGKIFIYNLNGDLLYESTPSQLGWTYSNWNVITCDGDDFYIHGIGTVSSTTFTFTIHFKITSSFSHYYDKLIENYRY